MITYTQASTLKELEQILALQQQNLIQNISAEERKNEGFLTVEHDMDILKAMEADSGISIQELRVDGLAIQHLDQLEHRRSRRYIFVTAKHFEAFASPTKQNRTTNKIDNSQMHMCT